MDDLGYEHVVIFTARVVRRAYRGEDVHEAMEEALRTSLGPDTLLQCESTTAKLDTYQGWQDGPAPPFARV